MPVPYRRAVAGVLTAAAVAVPVAALASGSDSPGAKPTPPSTALKTRSTAEATKSAAASQLSALAASAGISESRLEAGLAAAKRARGNTAAGVAAFARAAGVSPATAQRIVDTVFGKQGKQVDHSMKPDPSAVAALAAQLGVSTRAARHALQQIGALSGEDGVDPASTAFAAIAHQLGVSPSRLAGALGAVKLSMAGR